jgi:hypothetical protein
VKPLKMYVLLRKDLAQIYAGAQAGHAVAKFALEYRSKLEEWNNHTIVYLGIANEYVMNIWLDKLKESNKYFSAFFEPDLGDRLTAIACVDTGEIFKKLSLA